MIRVLQKNLEKKDKLIKLPMIKLYNLQYKDKKIHKHCPVKRSISKLTTKFKKNSFILDRDQIPLKTLGNKEQKFSKISIGKVDLSKNKTPNKIKVDYKSNFSNYSSVNNVLMKNKNTPKTKMGLMEKVVKPNKSFCPAAAISFT